MLEQNQNKRTAAEIESVFGGMQNGESATLKLAQSMDPELGKIAQLVIRRDHPQQEPPKNVAWDIVLNDSKSMIDFVNKFGSPEVSAIFIDVNRAVFVKDAFSRSYIGGIPDTAELNFAFDPYFLEWKVRCTSASLDHKGFIDFIQNHEDDFADGEYVKILSAYSKIETTIGMKRETRLDDNEGYQAMFSFISKTSQKAEPIQLPQTFVISVPVFLGGPEKSMLIDIRVIEPKQPQDQAMFRLHSRNLEAIERCAIRDEIKAIAEGVNVPVYSGIFVVA